MIGALLIGSALMSAASGVAGFVSSKEQEKSYNSAAKSAAKSANEQIKIAKKTQTTAKLAAKYERDASVAASKLEDKSADLDVKATQQEIEAIAQETGAAIFSALLQGESDARNYEAQAWAADYNAKVAGQMARASQESAKADASDYRRLQGARAATARAARAKSGFTLEGSPMMVDTAIFSEIELGAARLQYAGDVEFFDHLNEQHLLQYEAANARGSATFAREAAKINAEYAKQAGSSKMTGALLGVEEAYLKKESAAISKDTAEKKKDIDVAVSEIDYESTTTRAEATAKETASSAKRAAASARSEGINSLISGFGSAISTLGKKWG